jgi:tyrosinase
MGMPPNPQVPRIPEMVGATSAPFELASAAKQVSIPLQAPTGPSSRDAESLANWAPRRVVLNFEKIIGAQGGSTYDVYLNLPPGESPQKHPELYAGSIPMFGLRESSISDDFHTPGGLYKRLEVTNLYARLALQKDWNPTMLRITFVPTDPIPVPSISVGRASLYFG